jgi:adenylate cyclase
MSVNKYLYKKNVAKEIERKFLVKGEFKNLAVKKIQISQGYLSVDPERIVRLRISDSKSFLAIKSPVKRSGFTRNEWEIEIPFQMASGIMEICLPGKVIKTRHIIPFRDHVFEVDVFHGKNDGLIIAEIELASEDEKFEKPDWLAEEVTGKPEYYNSNLI